MAAGDSNDQDCVGSRMRSSVGCLLFCGVAAGPAFDLRIKGFGIGISAEGNVI